MLGLEEIEALKPAQVPDVGSDASAEVRAHALDEWLRVRGIDPAGVEEWAKNEVADDFELGLGRTSLMMGTAGIIAWVCQAYEYGLRRGILVAEHLASADRTTYDSNDTRKEGSA